MACEITRYDCPKNVAAVEAHGRNANVQQDEIHGFVSIYPWMGACRNSERHYVARIPNGTICGWLAASTGSRMGFNYIYISEISAIRIQDEKFRGVGRRMHDRFLEDAKAENVDFIYLFPLNDVVKETYLKWGYIQPDKEMKHMFYILKRAPTDEFRESLRPVEPNPRTYLAAAHDLAMQAPRDEELLQLIMRKRRNLLEDPKLVEELKLALDMIEGIEIAEMSGQVNEEELPTMEEKRDILRDVLVKVKGGRRKTRSQRKQRKQKQRKTRTANR